MAERREHPTIQEVIIDLIRQGQISQQQIASSLLAASESIARLFGGVAERLQPILASLAPFVEALPEISRRFNEAQKSLFENLVDYSWFIDEEQDIGDFLKVTEAVLSKNGPVIDNVMEGYFRTSLDAIGARLLTRHPQRALILKDAFDAHRNGRYTLSVPAFIIQADGISAELLGIEYFLTAKSRDRAEALLKEAIGDTTLELSLRALVPTGALREHSSKRRDNSLNRHAIIHGADAAYANERNSLKAISLLSFMSSTLALKLEHDQKRLVEGSSFTLKS